jgi:5'(3')-deoxyribonucleotidase
MKLLLENWREYLNEEQEFPYQIYCDMDGVLVDFIQGVVKQMNKDIKDSSIQTKEMIKLREVLKEAEETKIGMKDLDKHFKPRTPVIRAARNYMYKAFADDEKFWADLPWMPDGRELWEFISQFDPDILTSPMRKGSERGKQRWIDEHLKPAPKRVFMSREKYKWATNGQPSVLIDDFISNTIPWENAGGIAILHTSAAETLETLEELMAEPPEEDV